MKYLSRCTSSHIAPFTAVLATFSPTCLSFNQNSFILIECAAGATFYSLSGLSRTHKIHQVVVEFVCWVTNLALNRRTWRDFFFSLALSLFIAPSPHLCRIHSRKILATSLTNEFRVPIICGMACIWVAKSMLLKTIGEIVETRSSISRNFPSLSARARECEQGLKAFVKQRFTVTSAIHAHTFCARSGLMCHCHCIRPSLPIELESDTVCSVYLWNCFSPFRVVLSSP